MVKNRFRLPCVLETNCLPNVLDSLRHTQSDYEIPPQVVVVVQGGGDVDLVGEDETLDQAHDLRREKLIQTRSASSNSVP